MRKRSWDGVRVLLPRGEEDSLAIDNFTVGWYWIGVVMILPQVHLRKPCYDFTFL